MNSKTLAVTVVLTSLLASIPVLAETYGLVVNGEELKFVAQPERGYVVKLAERTGDIAALSGISMLDAKDATPVRGLDRHGVWIVENEGPSSRNEARIQSLSIGGQVAYAAPLFSSNGETVAIIPEIVVRVKPDTGREVIQKLCERAGCTIKKRMEFTAQEYLLEVFGPDAEAVFAAVEMLTHCLEIEWACPNTVFRPRICSQIVRTAPLHAVQLGIASAGEDTNSPGVFPNDEYFPMQWHLHNTGQSGGTRDADINAPEAWEITTGDPNTVVAVIDFGVDSNHPDLVNNLVPGYDFDEHDNSPDPRSDEAIFAHGTECAGLIAAQGNNDIGVTGAAWDCKIMPIRIDITGDTPTNEADIATAYRWAAAHGADVLSNSWYDFSPIPIIRSALVDVTKPDGLGRDGKGCVVLFGAGNESGPVTWPALYPEVIAVGATDHTPLVVQQLRPGT